MIDEQSKDWGTTGWRLTFVFVALGKGIQYQGFQELSSWMDCCLQSAIHRGWKAWVLTSFGVYAHVLQTTWYSTLNHLEESHHGNRWRHSWGHLKDDQGMTFLATCCCKYWTWLLGTWWQCEPISQCLDIKRWPCFFSHCHALDQWWMEAQCHYLHYVWYLSTEWLLFIAEELLIDFHKLIGAHSGKNLAHAVYDILNLYSLRGHISSWVFYFCFIQGLTMIHRSFLSMTTMLQTTIPWLNT